MLRNGQKQGLHIVDEKSVVDGSVYEKLKKGLKLPILTGLDRRTVMVKNKDFGIDFDFEYSYSTLTGKLGKCKPTSESQSPHLQNRMISVSNFPEWLRGGLNGLIDIKHISTWFKCVAKKTGPKYCPHQWILSLDPRLPPLKI